MIIDNRSVSLSEAAKIMKMSEEEVFKLTKYGYLQAARPIQGRTMVSLNSIEAYARRNQITLQEAPKPSVGRSGSLTVQETMERLGLRNEKECHVLIQAVKLKAHMENGIYKVDAESVRNYILGA